MPRLDAKPTDRPWSVQRKREVCPESNDLFTVAYASGADQSEAEANAAFIAHACNAHDSLVAAVSFALKYHKMMIKNSGKELPAQLVSSLEGALKLAQ